MKVLFLDIDGVVATFESYQQERDPYEGRLPEEESHKLIVPELVENVQKVCDATGASVVICSAWRNLFDWELLCGWLRDKGLTAPIIGRTPFKLSASRGSEISLWLADASGVSDYVVLDDDGSCIIHGPHWVQPGFYDGGFTEEYIPKAIQAMESE